MTGLLMLLLSWAVSACAGPFEDGQAAAAAGDYAKAAKLWRPLAKHGDVAAQDSLGVMCLTGRGTERNYEEAMNWFRKAAKQGDATAQTQLGLMYLAGKGADRDDAEGAKWIRLAADHGDALAEVLLGDLCATGRGMRRDEAEAEKWYMAAARQNHVLGQIRIGGVFFVRSACRQGTRGELGDVYYTPCPDDSTALRWYRLAAAQGSEEARRALAIADSLAFKMTRWLKTRRLFEQYLALYPDGRYVQEATAAIAGIEYAAAREANTIEAYQGFIDRHPDDPRARDLVFEDAKRQGTPAAFDQFLSRFPDSGRTDEARIYRSTAQVLAAGPGSRPAIKALTPIGEGTGLVVLNGNGTIGGDGCATTFVARPLTNSMSGMGIEVAFGHGTIYRFSGKISFSDVFGNPSVQILKATDKDPSDVAKRMLGYVFDSPETMNDPLTFVVTRNYGFVYVSGKGTVTLPGGKQMRL
jgi:TPR repeat protein